MKSCSADWEAAHGVLGYAQCVTAKRQTWSWSPQPQHGSAQACTLMRNMQQLSAQWLCFFKVQASTTAILVLYPGSIKIWLLLQASFVSTTRRG